MTTLIDPSTASNRSLFIRNPKELFYADRPLPELVNDNDVLVSVEYTGICGSDIHFWRGSLGFPLPHPLVLGHESSGTVVKVGPAVKPGALKPGDRIAMESNVPCRFCRQCLSGHYNLCPDLVFAASPPYHGTLTGFYVLPYDLCHKLPSILSIQEGALIEPLAVAVHAVRLVGVSPGDSVVVMGAGPVGILCGAVAKAFGASTVINVDVVDKKLDFARSFSGVKTYKTDSSKAPPEAAAAILEAAGLSPLPRGGCDIVIDGSGFEQSIQTSLHVVRRGGRYVQVGMGRADITFPIMEMVFKEVHAVGSFRYGSGDYELAIKLASSGQIPVGKLISDVVSFDGIEEAYKEVAKGETIKVLIKGPNVL